MALYALNFILDYFFPDTFFILGKGDQVKWNSASSIKLSDETGR